MQAASAQKPNINDGNDSENDEIVLMSDRRVDMSLYGQKSNEINTDQIVEEERKNIPRMEEPTQNKSIVSNQHKKEPSSEVLPIVEEDDEQ